MLSWTYEGVTWLLFPLLSTGSRLLPTCFRSNYTIFDLSNNRFRFPDRAFLFPFPNKNIKMKANYFPDRSPPFSSLIPDRRRPSPELRAGPRALMPGMAQCPLDMTASDCRTCLAGMTQMGPQYFSGKQGGRILGLRCNYRYEQYPFFSGGPLLQLPEPPVGAPAPVNATPTPATTTRGRGEFWGQRCFLLHSSTSFTFWNRGI